MSEIMDDYDVGYDAGYHAGLLSGKKFTETKMLELMDEVIEKYESSDASLKSPAPPISALQGMKDTKWARIDAVKFTKSWVAKEI